MTDDELRALVREAIAHHAAATTEPARPSLAPRLHASHGILAVAAGSELDGPCIIEPSVMCNHCGYCKSLGH